MKKFTLTNDHIKLIRNMCVSWEDCEFGAPSIDCKRPYGNSDVVSDIAKILDIKPIETDDEYVWPKGTTELCEKIHLETKTALQIILAVGYFKVGDYMADDYSRDWRPI